MRKLILILLLVARAYADSPANCVSNCGIASVDNNIISNANQACVHDTVDSSHGTCTWDTTITSDSLVTTVDINQGNGSQWIYNPSMVRHHVVQLVHIQPAATFAFYVSSNSHNTSLGCDSGATWTATGLPTTAMTDKCWVSTGPVTRAGTLGKVTTIARPNGVLSSWWVNAVAPKRVFQGQEFFIATDAKVGIGTPPPYMIVSSITMNTPSGPVNCSQGSATGTQNCQVSLPASNDFIIVPQAGEIFFHTNSSSNYLLINYRANIGNGPLTGYYTKYAVGQPVAPLSIYVAVGASVPVGSYTITARYTPADINGDPTTAGVGSGLQYKDVSATFTVEAPTPLASSPPTSFPPWGFKGQYLAMLAYWGTWNCSNSDPSAAVNRGGAGPWAYYNTQGVYESVPFTINNWGRWAWNYDGGRVMLEIGDRLFSTAHSDWTSGAAHAIGDIITDSVTGKTFILDVINGAAQPGLTANSGTSRPAFGSVTRPGDVVSDNGGTGGPLQWRDVENKVYWQNCFTKANDGYKNNIIMTQGQGGALGEPYQWAAGILMGLERTGDASAGDETGFSYTEANAPWGGLKGIFGVVGVGGGGSPTDPECSGLSMQGFPTYWTGSSTYALCMMAGEVGANNRVINNNRPGYGRIHGLSLDAQVAYWLATNSPTGLNPAQTVRLSRSINRSIAELDVIETHDPTSAWGSEAINVGGAQGALVWSHWYQQGQVAMGLIHAYQAQVYYSTGAFAGSGIVPNPAIPIALKRIADYLWVNHFDRIYDKNQSAADGCSSNFLAPICQGNRRIHSYCLPYDSVDMADIGSHWEFEYYSDMNSFVQVYAWLWAYNSTMAPPSNGRTTVSTYEDIAEIAFQHSLDGRAYSIHTTTSGGFITSWGVADYVNGGSLTGIGFDKNVYGSKEINQAVFEAAGEGIAWLTGEYGFNDGAVSRSKNPCWIAGNRNPDGSCDTTGGKHSEFADVQAPTPFNFARNQTVPSLGEPTICIPGNYHPNGSVTYNASMCGLAPTSANWTYPTGTCSTTVGSCGLGTNGIDFSRGGLPGNYGLGLTTATFAFATVKNTTQCWVTYGTGVTPNPPDPPTTTVNESPAHTPILVGGTPLPLWAHFITLTGLTPAIRYHFSLSCTDSSGNTYTMPYMTASVAGIPAIAYGVYEAGNSFVTSASQFTQFFLPIYDSTQ